jgi:hypothetical protein
MGVTTHSGNWKSTGASVSSAMSTGMRVGLWRCALSSE